MPCTRVDWLNDYREQLGLIARDTQAAIQSFIDDWRTVSGHITGVGTRSSPRLRR